MNRPYVRAVLCKNKMLKEKRDSLYLNITFYEEFK